MNRKVLASAMTVGVLSAPVAIAVADENDTETTDSPEQAAQLHQYARTTVDVRENAAERARKADARAERKKKAKQRAKKRAKKRAKQQAAQGQTQTAAAPQQSGGSTASAGLEGIAACESGGDPGAVGGGGTYRGKYQFDQQTWNSVGGSGDPAAASESEQDKRAAMLYSQRGASAWPVCGQ